MIEGKEIGFQLSQYYLKTHIHEENGILKRENKDYLIQIITNKEGNLECKLVPNKGFLCKIKNFFSGLAGKFDIKDKIKLLEDKINAEIPNKEALVHDKKLYAEGERRQSHYE